MSAMLSLLSAPLFAQAPIVDYHQHLFSPGAAALVTGNPNTRGISARDLIALLDSARIQRALVLSVAYTWGKASRSPVANEYEHVKAENDWTAQQVAQYPERLRAFCSFNPLKAYALEELARCSRNPQLHHGLKLHFGNSDVDLDNPANVAQVRKIFEAANSYHMPIVVHMHTSLDKHRKYGAHEARVFLNELLPSAADVPVQIAHLAGSGGYDDATDAALGVFANAITRHDARMKNVWFDASVVVRPSFSAGKLRQIAARIRQIGVERVLYGSDAAASPDTYPRAGWAAFRRLPLSEAEFRLITNNITPYMRGVAARASETQTSTSELSSLVVEYNVSPTVRLKAGDTLIVTPSPRHTGTKPIRISHGTKLFVLDALAARRMRPGEGPPFSDDVSRFRLSQTISITTFQHPTLEEIAQ